MITRLDAELDNLRSVELSDLKDYVTRLEVESDHDRSIWIPALRKNVARLKAELDRSRTTPEGKDWKHSEYTAVSEVLY